MVSAMQADRQERLPESETDSVSRLAAVPDTEVVARARRRQFTAGYKLRILEEADRCHRDGELGALLRREGLYSSHVAQWRRQRATGALAGLAPRKRGRPAASNQELEVARL